MKATIVPSKLTAFDITIPPSKSLAHRAVICAALAQGHSRIDHIDYSIDIRATLRAMEVAGAKVTYGKDYVEIDGIDSLTAEHDLYVDCEESGSTLRFLIPLFSLFGKKVTFTGKGRLMQRPQSIYEKLFEENGTPLSRTENQLIVNGSLQGGIIHLRGDVSSQFISGLLFALPLLKTDSTLIIDGPFESKSYVDLTVQMLKKFGVYIQVDDCKISIPGNQSYASCNVCVEGDYSQLAFYAALGVVNGPLTCHGLQLDSKQGDRAIVSIIEHMGASVKQFESIISFEKSTLSGVVIDLADCPDLGPALMMLASFAQGETKIINAGRLRIKESDRIEAMESELRKCGVQIHSTEDTVWIKGNANWYPNEVLSGHNDHRIVMALAIGATIAQVPVTIEGAQAINKSYPGFFEDIKKLGVEVHAE
ncbi:MAG: 3-phosphoshikimate 1-carboxyvinyltransferase [Erysipelotrichaceae bacterium]|nr:3-phosphoshikimate 1-carboxyvinyltransferase [Erysipelotrichaceae bacterium]